MHKIQHMDMAQPEQICSITKLLDNAKTANMDRDNEWLITQPFCAGLFWGRTHGQQNSGHNLQTKLGKYKGVPEECAEEETILRHGHSRGAHRASK